jgi:hypothetical protein
VFDRECVQNGTTSGPNVHFCYVCSDLSMNRGAFDAENYTWLMSSAPPSSNERVDRPDEDAEVV